jgi:hypothetical protein
MGYVGVKPSAVPLTSADITDGIITSAKIADGTIVNADINASAAIASTKLSGSFGITEADQWRLTANITTNTNPITSNLERNDNVGFNYIGTGMTVASGTWTFPTTGIWLVRFISRADPVADDNVLIDLNTTTNNSTYALAAESAVSGDGGAQGAATAVTETIFDVTNTSTHKVQFSVDSITAGSTISGNTSYNHTYFTFIRLGDT